MDHSDWDARYAGDALVWGVAPNRFVEREFAGVAPGRALDLAAGEGRNALWLAAAGWRVTAVDFSAVALDRGRELAERGGVDVDWVVADLLEYQPEERAYDAVLVVYLHIPPAHRATVLARAAKAVAAGGRALVVGHDLENLGAGVGGPQDPAILYTPEAIATELGDLTVLRAERVRRPVEVEGEVRDAIDTLVSAVRT